MRSPILGGFSKSFSTNLSDNEITNLYLELVDTKDGKAPGALYLTPGLDFFVTAGSGPIRGLHRVASTVYIVSGSNVYALIPGGTPSLLGSIGTSVGQVSIIDNGTQINIFDGSQGYLIASGVLSTLSLPFTNPTIGTEMDGFGLVLEEGTNKIWQSNQGDLSTWNALNFGVADQKPDNCVALFAIHDELFVIKEKTTEVWDNAGLSGFAFQEVTGVHIESGCVAPFSVAKCGETLVWLSRTTLGSGIVVEAQGYNVKPVSTQALTNELDTYMSITDAVAYSYQQAGHVFYVISFPSADKTWAYDVTASSLAGVPIWHRRAQFLNGEWHQHQAICFSQLDSSLPVPVTGPGLLGDYQSGNIYTYDLNGLTDNGVHRKWLRRWRALDKPNDKTTRFSSLRIDMETGAAGTSNVTSPNIMLRWSDDGGHTWSDYRIIPVGLLGNTAAYAKTNRLGSTRRFGRLDRIFEVSSADPFKVAIVGADIEVS